MASGSPTAACVGVLGGLAALEARLARDLELLTYPPAAWMPETTGPDGRRMLDVAIIGGGMCGLTAAFALKRAGLSNTLILDRNPAGREGPWVTYARMRTLRSPKQLTGPAQGLPNLTFRAWYEAQFGLEAWEALGKIPREMWMDYLRWYRRVLELPVVNDTEVTEVEPLEGRGFRLTTVDGDGERSLFARKVVLANGRDGLGGPMVPRFMEGVDRRFWAHSSDEIDFRALAGKRVAVIGIGASAVDNAAVALEHGAAMLRILVRRADIPRVNKLTGVSSPGLVHGFPHLSDAWRWRIMSYAGTEQVPPPRESVLRVTRHAQAEIHLDTPVKSVTLTDDGHAVDIATPRGQWTADFLILGTGFSVDPGKRPELSGFADQILQWRDRYIEPGEEDSELAEFPYLGPAFEFCERWPGQAPFLRDLHCFNYAATLSQGKVSGDIPAVSEGAQRLAEGLCAHFYVDDASWHYERLKAFDRPEIFGDEWADSAAPIKTE